QFGRRSVPRRRGDGQRAGGRRGSQDVRRQAVGRQLGRTDYSVTPADPAQSGRLGRLAQRAPATLFWHFAHRPKKSTTWSRTANCGSGTVTWQPTRLATVPQSTQIK